MAARSFTHRPLPLHSCVPQRGCVYLLYSASTFLRDKRNFAVLSKHVSMDFAAWAHAKQCQSDPWDPSIWGVSEKVMS